MSPIDIEIILACKAKNPERELVKIFKKHWPTLDEKDYLSLFVNRFSNIISTFDLATLDDFVREYSNYYYENFSRDGAMFHILKNFIRFSDSSKYPEDFPWEK